LNRINKIGIGTVQFGLPYGINNTFGQTKEDEVKIILQIASKHGIKYLDTAHAYGDSEIVLGNQVLNNFNIVSKFNAKTNQAFYLQLNETLTRLKTNSLYGYLAHSVQNLADNPHLIQALNETKSKGIVKKIGCSFNHSSEIELINRLGFKPDLIQIPYNIFDNRFKQYAIKAKEWNCEVHSRSSFLQGLFFCNTQQLHPYFEPLVNDINNLQGLGEHLINMLLSYCVNQPFIDIVVVGVNNALQLEQNINDINTLIEFDYPNFQFDESLITPSEWPK
jgi:aryl-alcohol dehydrogenase-like predicted oxidoreductase